MNPQEDTCGFFVLNRFCIFANWNNV